MPDRSWFYAANGQQQGPYPETQLRDLISKGAIRADTLVWTEGMAGWQRTGEIPGLLSGGASGPRAVLQPNGRPISAGGDAGGPISADLGVWEFFWRTVVAAIGFMFVIPIPWVTVWYCRWFVSRLHVPQRPNLGFAGRPMELWWLLAGILVSVVASLLDMPFIELLTVLVQLLLYWFFLKWFIAHITSDGHELPVRFEGSPWGWVGWQLLTGLSVITIIGWAWVTAAWMRWICRHFAGNQREVVFNGTGLEILWRTVVLVIASSFIIPIPWVMAWYYRWYVSQFALVSRTA